MKHKAKILDTSVKVRATGVEFVVVCCAGTDHEKQVSGLIEKMHKLTPSERLRRLKDVLDEVEQEHAAEHAASESVSNLLTSAGLVVKEADCCSGGATPAAIALDDTPDVEAMPVDVAPVPPAQDPAAVVDVPPIEEVPKP
jgi:hypothetical protein